MSYANLFLSIWELGRVLLGNLDGFCLGSWLFFPIMHFTYHTKRGEACTQGTLTYFCASKEKAAQETGFTGCEVE